MMWWDQKKELLEECEADQDLDGFLDDTQTPLRFRHFIDDCAEGCYQGADVSN